MKTSQKKREVNDKGWKQTNVWVEGSEENSRESQIIVDDVVKKYVDTKMTIESTDQGFSSWFDRKMILKKNKDESIADKNVGDQQWI